MKKIVIMIIAMSLIFSGCASKTRDGVDAKETEISQVDIEKIMSEYTQFINGEKKPYEMINWVDEYIQRVPMENADEMILVLEEVQRVYMQEYTDALFHENRAAQDQLCKAFDEELKIEEIEDPELKGLLIEIIHGGYKFVSLEGEFYPIIDYEKLKKYFSYLSNNIKDYIEIMAVESNELMWNDGAVVIAWDELADRTLKSEDFLSEHTEGKKRKEISELYMMYLGTYMNGSVNSPLFNWETKKLRDEVLNSYKRIISENSGTTTARTVHQYLKRIEENDFKVNDKIMKEGYVFYNQAAEELQLSRKN